MPRPFAIVPILCILAAISASPGSAAHSDARLTCQSMVADNATVIDACTRMIGVATGRDRALALGHRGLAHNRNGDYERATADFDEALRLQPDLIPALFGRGFSYEQRGERDKAIADYRQAYLASLGSRGARPHWAEIRSRLRQLGVTDQEIGRWAAEARIANYDRMILRDPNSASAYRFRCYEYSRIGEHDRALADCDRAVVIAPGDASSYYSRGRARAASGDYHGAVADLSEAIRQNALPSWNRSVYMARGNAYIHIGDLDRAISDFTLAIAISPRDWIAYRDRAKAYQMKGEHELAASDQRTADRLRRERPRLPRHHALMDVE